MKESVCSDRPKGFGLIEVMVALFVLTFGLLATGQLFFIASGSGSLAGSKGSAAIFAQNTLESLAALYQQNPSAEDLAPGGHGPREFQATNPADETVLNRYAVSWIVSPVPDPRPAKALDAKLVRVTVTPISMGGASNNRLPFNKTLQIATIFSPTMR